MSKFVFDLYWLGRFQRFEIGLEKVNFDDVELHLEVLKDGSWIEWRMVNIGDCID